MLLITATQLIKLISLTLFVSYVLILILKHSVLYYDKYNLTAS